MPTRTEQRCGTHVQDGTSDTAPESSSSDDCNDADAAIFPAGASGDSPDDGIDQDCSGSDTITCIVDADQDGFGTVTGHARRWPTTGAATRLRRRVHDVGRLRRHRATAISPAGTEVPDDGIDQDCSGTDTITCIVDADQDGFGTTLGTTTLAADGTL